MCVGYFDLNKACLKDFYPFPNIDQLIDATWGHELLSFINTFSAYNQIKMYSNDWKKMVFLTHKGVFIFLNMPFGLINAGATFQKMMDKIFANQISRNMEVYMDDMIVKSKLKTNHVTDLQESFDTIRQHHMKLRSTTCSFCFNSCKFLGI